jgi:sarcosine oxidase subunit alpha
MAPPRPIALSALHHVHLALGAEMDEGYGWLRPVRYTNPEDECEAVRGGVGLCDTSPSGKLLLHGEIDRYIMEGLQQGGPEEPGDAGLMQFTEDSGIGDILAARLAADEALLVTAPNQSPMVAETLGSIADACAHSVDVTSARTGICVAGPAAQLTLAAVTETDTSPHSFPDLSCAQGSISQVHATVIRHDLGELACYYIYVDRAYGEYLWETLVEAGSRYGITPFGTTALSQLHPQSSRRAQS